MGSVGVCEWETCDLPLRAGRSTGYCNAHYLRQCRGTDMAKPVQVRAHRKGLPTQCSHKDCTDGYYASGLCKLHYGRRYNGQDMDSPRKYGPRVPYETTRYGPNGYRVIWAPDHPNAYGSGWLLEHRYVMEQQLGRRLLPDENVHHINGVRDDNRPQNLELWVTSQPSGQRVTDLVSWANEILRRYS